MLNPKPLDPDDFQGLDLSDVINAIIVEINTIKQVLIADEAMRANNPALQDAYNKYLMIKRLSE